MSNDDNPDENAADNDGDEHGAVPLPFVPPPPPAGPVEGALDIGHAADVQRLQPPSADAQRLQPDVQTGTHHDAQRLGHESVDAQRGQPNLDAQRADTMEHTADVHRAASDVQRGRRVSRARSFRHLRPRFLLAAAVAAAGAGTAIVLAADDDDPPRIESAPTIVTAPSITDPPTRTEPPATAASATDAVDTTEPVSDPSTSEAPTTVPETTVPATTVPETTIVATTVPAPSSFGGVYDVTVSGGVLSSPGIPPIQLPQQASQQWQLSGPCDGIGECTMAPAGGTLGPAGGGPGIVESATLLPTGAGTYGGGYEVDSGGCGIVVGTFAVTFVGGGFTGTWMAEGAGDGGNDCPPFTVSANVAGTLIG